jgi:hypothetical protein
MDETINDNNDKTILFCTSAVYVSLEFLSSAAPSDEDRIPCRKLDWKAFDTNSFR